MPLALSNDQFRRAVDLMAQALTAKGVPADEAPQIAEDMMKEAVARNPPQAGKGFVGKVGPEGYIHGWIYVGTGGSKISDLDHEKIGDHFGSDVGDDIKSAQEASAAGDHEGAIHHIDDAYGAIADHVQEKRASGEEAPDDQYDHEALLNTLRDHRQHEANQAAEAQRAASPHRSLLHRR